MYKPMEITSRNLEIELPKSTNKNIGKEHLTIIIQADNQKEAEAIAREMRMTVHRMNRQRDKKIRYRMIKKIRSSRKDKPWANYTQHYQSYV